MCKMKLVPNGKQSTHFVSVGNGARFFDDTRLRDNDGFE